MRLFSIVFVVGLACPACAERAADTSSNSQSVKGAAPPSVMKRINVPHLHPLNHVPAPLPPAGKTDAGSETAP